MARVRAKSFWYRDGLGEMLVGINILLQNGFTLVLHCGDEKSAWYWPLVMSYLLLFLVFAVRAPRIMTAMRERIVYPRSGYAEPGESVRKLNRTVVALTILAIFGFIVAVRYGRWDAVRWQHDIPVVGGLFYCVIGAYMALRLGVFRHLLIGLFAIALGLAIDIEYPVWSGIEIWLFGLGCAYLIAGGLTLWRFIRATPLIADQR